MGQSLCRQTAWSCSVHSRNSPGLPVQQQTSLLIRNNFSEVQRSLAALSLHGQGQSWRAGCRNVVMGLLVPRTSPSAGAGAPEEGKESKHLGGRAGPSRGAEAEAEARRASRGSSSASSHEWEHGTHWGSSPGKRRGLQSGQTTPNKDMKHFEQCRQLTPEYSTEFKKLFSGPSSPTP